ncbi:hypothetical protein Tco_0419416, partial [Tanacetum coccineum]
VREKGRCVMIMEKLSEPSSKLFLGMASRHTQEVYALAFASATLDLFPKILLMSSHSECFSNVFCAKEGYIYGDPSLWEAMRTANASNIGFHDEDICRLLICLADSGDDLKANNSDEQGVLYITDMSSSHLLGR